MPTPATTGIALLCGIMVAASTPAATAAAAEAAAPHFTVPDVIPANGNAPAGFDQKRSVPHGEIVTETYDSTALGFRRTLTVYKPPGYRADTTYPVLYLLHGRSGDETSWVKKGAANVILDNLYAEGKAVPMLVVMPYGFTTKPGEPKPDRDATPEVPQGAAPSFTDDLLTDIVPFVDAHYPTVADPAHRALAGQSMGGGQTWRIGPLHSNTFAWLGVFSAGLHRLPDGTQDDLTATYPDAATLNAALKLFWISCGDKDTAHLPDAKNLAQTLSDRQVNVVWHLDAGVHEWPVWRNDLYLFGQRLFKAP